MIRLVSLKGLLLFLFLAGCTIERQTLFIPTVDNNVCKTLLGNVVLYAIFVDTKYTKPWSEYDVQSTLDSINKTVAWIEQTAANFGHYVDIKVCYHQDNRGSIPIAQDFPSKTLSGTLFSRFRGGNLKAIDRWANSIASVAGKSLPKDTSRLIKTKNSLNDRERLIARLRDIYRTDNVALMFFINNYYTNEVSVALYTGSDYEIEYAVVSYKKPAVIGHEFLHLFGAMDLYITPFDNKKKAQKKKNLAMKEFPTEIMAFPYRSLDSLNLSQLTRYCIGWDKQLDKRYQDMLFGKKLRAAKY